MYNKTNINPVLQKRAMRTVNQVDYYEPTNILFNKLHALKLDFYSAEIMYIKYIIIYSLIVFRGYLK